MAKRHSNRIGDLESMFLRLEELVLANSGEDVFEEVFKLLVAKLCAERSENAGRFGADADEDKTYDAIVSLLREADRVWPGIVESESRPLLTPKHLQVCVDALSHHVISGSSFEVLDGFFESLVSHAAKGAKGQYFTPRYVIELCVRMLEPRSVESILDPACGSGGFLVHALNFVREREGLQSGALRRYCESQLWGFDIDPRAVRVAKTLMVLAGDGQSNILRLNSLLTPEMGGLFPISGGGNSGHLTMEDVMRSRTRHHKGFDIILTNPPFAGEVLERHVLDRYEVSRGKQRVERDVLFLERCIELLSPGGRMAIVLPHNKFAGNEFGDTREWVLRNCRVLAVIGLGRRTFLPHTHQKASILFVQKRASGEGDIQDEEIFFAVSERDGKNARGQLLMRPEQTDDNSVWNRVDHDFDEIVSGFKEFCGQRAIAMGN
jgi:type I restriction enzyme M protein